LKGTSPWAERASATMERFPNARGPNSMRAWNQPSRRAIREVAGCVFDYLLVVEAPKASAGLFEAARAFAVIVAWPEIGPVNAERTAGSRPDALLEDSTPLRINYDSQQLSLYPD